MKTTLHSRMHITFPTLARIFTCKQKSGTVAKLETLQKSEQLTKDLDLVLHNLQIIEVIYVCFQVQSKIKRFWWDDSKQKQQPALPGWTLSCIVLIWGKLQSNCSTRIPPLPKWCSTVIVTRGESFPGSWRDWARSSHIVQDALQLWGPS